MRKFRIPRKLKKRLKNSPYSDIFYRTWVSDLYSRFLYRYLRKLCNFGSSYSDKLYSWYGQI